MLHKIAKKAAKSGYSVEVELSELDALLSKNRKKKAKKDKSAEQAVTPEIVDEETSIVTTE